jgi:hypothetical protein
MQESMDLSDGSISDGSILLLKSMIWAECTLITEYKFSVIFLTV